MKTGVICIVAVFALAMASAARAHNIPTLSSQRQLTADDLVFARLHTLVLVNIRHTPLHKAITALADAAGVNVFVDWRSLAQNAIRRRTPVTLHLKGPIAARTVPRAVGRGRRYDQVNGSAVEPTWYSGTDPLF